MLFSIHESVSIRFYHPSPEWVEELVGTVNKLIWRLRRQSPGRGIDAPGRSGHRGVEAARRLEINENVYRSEIY